MKHILFSMIFACCAQVHAKGLDVLTCSYQSADTRNELHVFETGSGGYAFTASQMQKGRIVYQSAGDVQREYYRGAPLMVFNGETVRIFTAFKQYFVTDRAAGVTLDFLPEDCTLGSAVIAPRTIQSELLFCEHPVGGTYNTLQVNARADGAYDYFLQRLDLDGTPRYTSSGTVLKRPDRGDYGSADVSIANIDDHYRFRDLRTGTEVRFSLMSCRGLLP